MNKIFLSKKFFNTNLFGRLFTDSTFRSNPFKFISVTPNTFFTIKSANFARSIKSKSLKPSSSENSENSENSEENENNQLLKQEILTKENQPDHLPNSDYLEQEELSNLINDFYLQSKNFQIQPYTDKWDTDETLKSTFQKIYFNLKNLKNERCFSKLIRAIGYFKILDNNTTEIFSRSLTLSDKKAKTKLSLLVYYTIVKLNINKNDYDKITKKCFDILTESDFQNYEKSLVNPFIWALSEKEISNSKFNEKIDVFIKNKLEDLNEYEISILLRFYSKIFYFNYEVLELLLKRCLKFCSTLSLRYIIIITKCLAEMNIRNLNLLTGINERVAQIIKLNENYSTKKVEDQNIVTPDFICQLLSNLVKLEFIDYEEYLKYENMFFELAEKNGIKNKESVLTILSTHCKFYNNLYQETKKSNEATKQQEQANIDTLQKYKENATKQKKMTIKTKKDYKLNNEIFFEKFYPLLDDYKDNMNYKTCLNVMIIIKNMRIVKRNNLRNLFEFYTTYLENFLKEYEQAENKNTKLNYYLEIGFQIFEQSATQKNAILEKIKLFNYPHEKYYNKYFVDIKEGTKKKSERKNRFSKNENKETEEEIKKEGDLE